MQNGYDDVRNMGTSDFIFYSFLSRLIIFNASEARFYLINHHILIAVMHEGDQESKTEHEKEPKDASPFINVKRVL